MIAGRPVAAFRRECGLTQAQLAKAMRWSVRQVQLVEAGTSDLDRHLRPLAALFSRRLGRPVTAAYDLLGVPDTRRAKFVLLPSGSHGAPGDPLCGNDGAMVRAGRAGRTAGHP